MYLPNSVEARRKLYQLYVGATFDAPAINRCDCALGADLQCRIMHPRVDQIIQQLHWHASVEGESLDAEYCGSLHPAKVLAKARRAGLQIEEARAIITHLRSAKIGDSTDTDAPPLLTRSAFRLFSSALWDAFNQEVRPISCLLYTSPSPRDATLSRMPSSA